MNAIRLLQPLGLLEVSLQRVGVGGALGAFCRVLRRERVELRLEPRRELLRLLELRREHGALRRHLRMHR